MRIYKNRVLSLRSAYYFIRKRYGTCKSFMGRIEAKRKSDQRRDIAPIPYYNQFLALLYCYLIIINPIMSRAYNCSH